jgi:hypothetical protein
MTATDETTAAPDLQLAQFWREHAGQPQDQRRTVMGAVLTVPTDLPLEFEHRAHQLGASESVDDVKALLRMLFGADVLDTWTANGVTVRQFRFLLMWGTLCGQGALTGTPEETLAAAWPLYEQAEAAETGKALPVPNRAERRKKKRRR